jgi:hypothetical protein
MGGAGEGFKIMENGREKDKICGSRLKRDPQIRGGRYGRGQGSIAEALETPEGQGEEE